MKQTSCKLCGATFRCYNGMWFTTCNCAKDRPAALAATQVLPANEKAAKEFRQSLAGDIEGTRESVERSAKMLETYAPDLYPANELGQVDFSRAMMESAADEVMAFLSRHDSLVKAVQSYCGLDGRDGNLAIKAWFAENTPVTGSWFAGEATEEKRG